jgi:hypothetical protein
LIDGFTELSTEPSWKENAPMHQNEPSGYANRPAVDDARPDVTALNNHSAEADADAIWAAGTPQRYSDRTGKAPARSDGVMGWVGVNNPYASKTLDELVTVAKGLNSGSADFIEDILRAALSLRETEVRLETLVVAIAKSKSGLGLRVLRTAIKRLKAEFDRASAPTDEELRQQEAATLAIAAEERTQRIRDLETLIRPLAADPNLMKKLIAYAHGQGVVGEDAAVVATFLTAVSRTLAGRAGCMVRTGAPSSGKNFVVEAISATLDYVRPDDPTARSPLIRLSSSSPLALVYSGGADDEDSLKGQLVYVPEASSLLDASGQERPGVGLLRTLISEGQINHHVALPVTDNNGSRSIETRKIVKHGPVALIVTTARENIEPEMHTRLMLVPADESSGQTVSVHQSRIERSCGFGPAAASGTTLDDWRNFQEWIGAAAPYEVVIPFYNAVQAAYIHMNLPLRARRDIDGILTGIKASAVAHRLQRDVEKGRIVATVDDYRWAHIAFAPGLAELYRPQVGQNVLALVRVIEQAIAEKRRKAADKQTTHAEQITSVNEVEISHDQIASNLGLSSRDVVTDRIRKAITAGLIEVTNPGAARSVRRSYRVLVSSQDVKANSGSYSAMPTPERVEELLSAFDAAPRDYPF